MKRGADEEKITSKEHEVLKGLYNSLSTLYPEFSLIDRGEKLEEGKDSPDAIIKRRLATSPVPAPSVMSFSVFKNGSPFHKGDTIRTKLENPPGVVVVNPGEGETLIPLGTTLKYTLDPTNEYQFFAKIVRSLAFEPIVSYWCYRALAEAYERYLSKPYSNFSWQVKINGKTIYRPNHGLAHTYRVMNYIPIIVNYFAHHGKDEEFRLFCQKMTKRQQEWLMVAAAFSVTGRQNEKSASEDREGYDSFRADCEGHLEQFLQAHPPEVFDDKMKKSILHIVRYMGNPGYEANWSELEKNERQGDAEQQRNNRNFMHRILTIAHKLDLLRCYTPNEYELAMKPCTELSEISDEQKLDYQQIIKYASDLIKAHGNELLLISMIKETIFLLISHTEHPLKK